MSEDKGVKRKVKYSPELGQSTQREDDEEPPKECINEIFCKYKDDVKAKAVDLITTKIPKKIVDLTEMINSGMFSNPPIETFDEDSKNQEDGYKEEANAAVMKISDVVVQASLQQKEDCALLSTWLSLLTPAMMDGHNLGVEVQAEVFAQINMLTEQETYDQCVYHMGRVAIITEILDFPDVEDCKHALKRYDEKQVHLMEALLTQIRDYYVGLHHSLQLNMDKLMNPRPQVDTGMI